MEFEIKAPFLSHLHICYWRGYFSAICNLKLKTKVNISESGGGFLTKVSKNVKKSTFPRVITFCVEKFGRNRLCRRASHSPSVRLKIKSQIWDCSYREKSKSFKNGEIEKLTV